ncbi:MAG: SIMPL domain-containing protein [Terriglobales bacterium]
MKTTSLFCLAFFFCAAAASQNPPTINAQANTVYVSAEGKYESAPDTALIQFSISAQEKVAKAAYSRMAEETEQLRQILRSNGVDPKSAEIGYFSQQPVYDDRTPKRKVIGYRFNAWVNLKLKDFSKIGPIVGSIGEQEWAEQVGLSYTLEDFDAAKVRAVDDAFQRARSEAAAVARAGGRTLGDLSYASVDTSDQVRMLATPMRAQAMSAMRPEAGPPTAEFTPTKISVSARVSAMFTMK